MYSSVATATSAIATATATAISSPCSGRKTSRGRWLRAMPYSIPLAPVRCSLRRRRHHIREANAATGIDAVLAMLESRPALPVASGYDSDVSASVSSEICFGSSLSSRGAGGSRGPLCQRVTPGRAQRRFVPYTKQALLAVRSCQQQKRREGDDALYLQQLQQQYQQHQQQQHQQRLWLQAMRLSAPFSSFSPGHSAGASRHRATTPRYAPYPHPPLPPRRVRGQLRKRVEIDLAPASSSHPASGRRVPPTSRRQYVCRRCRRVAPYPRPPLTPAMRKCFGIPYMLRDGDVVMKVVSTPFVAVAP